VLPLAQCEEVTKLLSGSSYPVAREFAKYVLPANCHEYEAQLKFSARRRLTSSQIVHRRAPGAAGRARPPKGGSDSTFHIGPTTRRR
jgi:hypothetical protein